jgi:hypothetical protein
MPYLWQATVRLKWVVVCSLMQNADMTLSSCEYLQPYQVTEIRLSLCGPS